MRILLICEYAPNEVHGIAVHLRNMVLCLEELGHEFVVFTSKPARQLKKEGYTDWVIDKYEHMGFCVTNIWNPQNSICVFPWPSLYAKLREYRPDIVHIFTPTIIGYWLFPYIRSLGIPIYASHHVDMVYYLTKYLPHRLNFGNLPGKALWLATGDSEKADARPFIEDQATAALSNDDPPCAWLNLVNIGHILYTFCWRVPAYSCADVNVAPSKASLDKEFVFFNNTGTNNLKDMPEAKEDPLFTNNSNLVNYAECLSNTFGMTDDGLKFQSLGLVDKKKIAPGCFDGIMGFLKKAARCVCTWRLTESRQALKARVRSDSRDTNLSQEDLDIKLTAFDDYVIPTSVPGKFTAPPDRDSRWAGKLRRLLNIEPGVKIVLMVNRLWPEKRVDLAIRQLAKAKFRNKYHLVIVGDGPSRKELEKLWKDLLWDPEYGGARSSAQSTQSNGSWRIAKTPMSEVRIAETLSKTTSYMSELKTIDQRDSTTSTSSTKPTSSSSSSGNGIDRNNVNITFWGAVANEVLPVNFYSGADFFLSASESETFGITLVEALGCNVLPIMPRCPVFDEFYGATLGEFMFRDEAELEELLERIHPKKYDVKALKGQLTKTFFSWRSATEATVEQYEAVVKSYKQQRGL